MTPEQKEIIEDAMKGQHEIHAMYELYESSLNEGNSFADWLYYLVDIADVNVVPEDFQDEQHNIDYAAFYRAAYNQVKAFIKGKINYAIDNWIAIDQPIES